MAGHRRAGGMAVVKFQGLNLGDAMARPKQSMFPLDLSHEALYGAHAEKVLTASAADLAPKMGLAQGQVFAALSMAHYRFNIARLQADSERARIAKDALSDVAACADALTAALRALGPAAVDVLQTRTGNPKVFAEAAPWELARDLVGKEPHWEVTATAEQNRQWAEEWERGGRWVIRLEALAKLARNKGRQVGAGAKGHGPAKLGAILHGSPNETLMAYCLKFVWKHRGPDPLALALAMAHAVIHAETKKKPNPQVGRKVLARLSQSLPK